MKTRRPWFISCMLVTLIYPAFVYGAGIDDGKYTLGVGLLNGSQISSDSIWYKSDKYRWNYTALCLTYGRMLSDRQKVYLEGDIGRYDFGEAGNSFDFSLNLMTSYSFIRFDKWNLFGEFGVGLGFWDRTPFTNFVDNGLLGNIRYGVGLEIQVRNSSFIRLAYRLTAHTSALCKDDTGINSDGFCVLWDVKRF